MTGGLRQQQQRRARLAAAGLLLLALTIYGGFILMAVHRSHG